METVFWSWQSDLDARVTRDLVRDALAGAIDELGAEMDERPELTSDTKGVPGSPDIVATILAKIDEAAVFVADVTPIAISESSKALANPNVLIELGYAKKAIGLNRIILVWNTAMEGAVPERLPFDLRGRRAPIGFHVPPSAPLEVLRAEREKLRSTFVDALRASLSARPRRDLPQLPEWQPAAPQCRGLWFDPSEPLMVNDSGVATQGLLEPTRHFYARVLPSGWTAPANFGQNDHAPLLGRTNGFSWGSTKGGFLTYSGSLRATPPPSLSVMTLQFRTTGELWALDSLISVNDNRRFFFADYVISRWNDFLDSAITYLQRQGAIGPFQVRLGATDLLGLVWVTETGWGGRPQALESEAEATFFLKDNSEAERLEAFDNAWGQIASAFGLPTPDRPTLVKQIRASR